ncbi:hypothetical protein WJ83_00495 [Burkholderia ubonensis]|uniref:hypothetical protein n=2 Tax=Burkholderia ubonensis TaxID=101571 RepID=UPI0007583C3D|nr:hypothetical protein [Burkholderia ubonensis]KVP04815.1 hypothetical protein WJ83_00495 [Burkholderia ubonensis]KVP62088.1 hypothetical protein WJ91_00070 [Burkholderia ubonensis]
MLETIAVAQPCEQAGHLRVDLRRRNHDLVRPRHEPACELVCRLRPVVRGQRMEHRLQRQADHRTDLLARRGVVPERNVDPVEDANAYSRAFGMIAGWINAQ